MHTTVRLVSLAGLAAMLAACSTLSDSIRSPGVPSHPWLGGDPPCKADVCTPAEAARAIAVAQSYCMDLRGFYERGGVVTGSQRLFVGVLGALAGSVFSVTAGGTAAKAWAGLSGATNGIQTQLDQVNPKGAGRHQVIARIAGAQQAGAADIRQQLDRGDHGAAVRAALMLPDACSAAAGLGVAEGEEAAASAAERVAAIDRAAAASLAATMARPASTPASAP